MNSGWRGRWIGWRNHWLSSPRFQRFAARFPLTRPIARRRARTLFDLVAGFTYSQILAACIETGLLEMLAEGPQDTATIAARIDLPLAGAERLLRGATALGLVERLGDGWALGGDGAALRGNRGIAEMVAHHRLLYADLADPVALLRRGGGGGALSGLWHYAEDSGRGDAASVADYSALMAASQPMVAAQAIDAYSFHRHRRLLDVGGGEGAFLQAVGERVPALALGLFDLPAVGDRARVRFDSAGLSTRTQIYGGDFLRNPLPPGYDIISLIRVLHDHDDASAMALLRQINRALSPGGTLFLAEPMAETRGAEPAGDAYFGFYLLAMGSGRPRSAKEIAAMLRAAGFSHIRHRRTAMPITTCVITAKSKCPNKLTI
ncbi:methyltransferase [Sphingomonas mollis]|uniref:Methyltransferase domain-containing protein n=1 Tax=Sphingomonas mollis TaxID=2795726 RepID=A0ABS0XT74_9SPHN|nr:methyltransferase [Sphingomonas sp. BT553]MBJ6122955.1 methyltransferase domain-containing protein [Sphingomonas sp. BT553]